MSLGRIEGQPIFIGYEWRLRLTIRGLPTFSAFATFKAQIRMDDSMQPALATLTTAEGTAVRSGPQSLELILPGETSSAWTKQGAALIDVVRTDLTPVQHLGFTLKVPVRLPVTRI